MLKGKTVRIVTGEEHSWGFWVTDAETGKPIPKLQGARIELMIYKTPVAHLQVVMPKVNVVATVDSVTELCPHCGSEREEQK